MTTMLSRTAAQRRQSGKGSRWFHEHGFFLMLMAPVAIYLLVTQIYPLTATVRESLFHEVLTRPQETRFVGVGNFIELLTRDDQFWPIVANSFVWVLGATALQLVAGTIAALILNQRVRARGFWRGLVMTPWITPVVVAAIAWRWIYDGQYGLLNAALERIGLPAQVWLGDSTTVWPALLLAATWKGMPYVALVVLAGLQGIPREIIEAAEVDGASGWRRFFYVTVPMLRPLLFVTGLIAILSSWFKFEMIWALTKGGPGYATSILPTYVYSLSFERFDFGMGAAVAVAAMVLVLIVIAAYWWLFGRKRDS